MLGHQTGWDLFAVILAAAAFAALCTVILPALGAIALLGAWLVTRLPHRETTPALGPLACAAVVAVMFGIGTASFHAMVQSPMGGRRIVHACPRHLQGYPPGQVRCSPSTGRVIGSRLFGRYC